MHFELLVEGQADRTALEPILKKILGEYGFPHTWRIHKHQGKGELPQNPAAAPDPKNRSLLHNLPASLRAYGRSLTAGQVVVVVVDLDDLDCISLKRDLVDVLSACSPPPQVLFRIAIEEIEAWLLGDQAALLQAYPNAKASVLAVYQQDSICGTWELIADAVHPGGSKALKARGRQSVLALEQKRVWAKNIAPLLDVDVNSSPSFCTFRDGMRRLAQQDRIHPAQESK